MQDSSATAAFQTTSPRFPEQEQNLRCPRCESTNTKFCYYNNYNLSQPRHFCKSCRRYWTKGGALRNIPIGGGTRKNSKRSSSSATANSKRSNPHKPSPVLSKTTETVSALDPDRQLLNMEGSFSSLLACDRQLDTLLGSFPLVNSASCVQGMEFQSLASWNRGNGDAMMPTGESYERFEGDSGCWAAGWADLAIYNPSVQWK